MKLSAFLLALILVTSIAGCVVDETVTPQGTAAQPCTGGACTTVSGRLVTAGGRQGLPGATVTVVWSYTPNFLTAITHIKARATTDATGYYQTAFFISDDELKNGGFGALFAADTSIYYKNDDSGLLLTKAKRDTSLQLANYLIPRKAKIKVSVSNQPQIQGNFRVEFFNAYGIQYGPGQARQTNGRVISFSAQSGQGNATVVVGGDQPLAFNTLKQVNGRSIRTTDTLFIPAGTTRDITVTY